MTRTSTLTLSPDFSTVTEIPLGRASADQLEMLYTRYEWASTFVSGKAVLEVACGAGIGLGLLARHAQRTVGGDIDGRNYEVARRTYAGRTDIEIRQFDAQAIPFLDASFDVVILFEALYYIQSPDRFFLQAKRVLRPGGIVLISTVNCRWAGFNRSPLSEKYYDAAELAEALEVHGYRVEMWVGFPEQRNGVVKSVIGLLRKIAIRLHLIPKTMRGKEWLKRLFYGELKPIPAELIPGTVTQAPMDQLHPPYADDKYRFIYAIGKLP